MSVIYLLLGVSITVAVVFFTVFWYAVRQGQFDDSYTPSVRMLFEDELVASDSKEESEHIGDTRENSNNLTKPLDTHGDSEV